MILANCENRRRIVLKAEHIFGRGQMADTILGFSDVSLLHAVVRWTGRAWQLRDLSRNGTLIDRRKAAHDRPIDLMVGAVLQFGRDPRAAWVVENLSKPSSLLWPLRDMDPVISLYETTHLPTPESPTLTLTPLLGRWLCDEGAESRWLADGDIVCVGEQRWVFVSGAPAQDTALDDGGPPVQDWTRAILMFHVSADEEHVRLDLVAPTA